MKSHPEEAILAFCHGVHLQRLHFGLECYSLSIGIMERLLLNVCRGCNTCKDATGNHSQPEVISHWVLVERIWSIAKDKLQYL